MHSPSDLFTIIALYIPIIALFPIVKTKSTCTHKTGLQKVFLHIIHKLSTYILNNFSSQYIN